MSWGQRVGGFVAGVAATSYALFGATSAATSSSITNPPPKLTKRCDKSGCDKLNESISAAIAHCEEVRHRLGLPGLAVSVSVNGGVVFERGFGFSDLENRISMQPSTVMRIASISKPMTMGMLAQFIEEGKVDIDIPVQTYVPSFPQKKWEGQPVTITTRHLLSHLSGIRHYGIQMDDADKGKEKKADIEAVRDSVYKEFYLQTGCDSLEKAMEIFKDDDLIVKPGTKYSYTTFGWTVVSAVVEKVAGISFEKHCQRMFQFWGLESTYLDKHDAIIPNRSRYYKKDNKSGNIINATWVDNSCKWAGGGFLSTVQDLNKFAHIMLYSVQQPNDNCKNLKAFLKKETVEKLWTGDKATAEPYKDSLYGLGWAVGDIYSNCVACNSRNSKQISHSGGAVGASSVLFIKLPKNCSDETKTDDQIPVKGIVVAMITNLEDIGLTATAKKLSKEFEWML